MSAFSINGQHQDGVVLRWNACLCLACLLGSIYSGHHHHHHPLPSPSTRMSDSAAATRQIKDWKKNSAVGNPPECDDIDTQVPVTPATAAMIPTQKPPTTCQSEGQEQ